MTMNSPECLTELFHLATAKNKDKTHAVQTVELMREVGLKCIGLNGVSACSLTTTFNLLKIAKGTKNNQLFGSIQSQFARRHSIESIHKSYEVGHFR